jgi:hypothetical protein
MSGLADEWARGEGKIGSNFEIQNNWFENYHWQDKFTRNTLRLQTLKKGSPIWSQQKEQINSLFKNLQEFNA